MNKSFYKNEAVSLKSLVETFKHIPFTVQQNKSSYVKESMIIMAFVFILIVVIVGFLTMWLLK